MSTDRGIEEIKQKIKRVLAMSSSSFDEEKRTAISMAQSLLAKYNLKMSDITLTEGPDLSKIGSERHYEQYIRWKALLINKRNCFLSFL